ncbi:MAG TPA: hypothetical protein VK902_07900 [Rubrobacter sp.]|nr:hypothetical protein [Rubrobacter sp.]
MLLELGDTLGDVPFDEGRVVPLERLLKCPRSHVLGVAVHSGAVLARLLLYLGPCGGETFIGHPPQEEGVGGGQLVE